MHREIVNYWSRALNRNMNIAIYGTQGLPVLAFPTQDSLWNNLEDFGIIETMTDWIDSGTIQVFVVDTIDKESWSDTCGDKGYRAWKQEEYFHFIVDEVVPYMHERNADWRLPIVTGFSMGGGHAAITFLRRPDLFSGLFAVSGVYNSDYFYGDWMNDILYQNTPTSFIRNMPSDHPYIVLYNSKQMIFCVGQGDWEDEGVRTLRDLQGSFRNKGINAWCDYWGYDVNHDWPWWKKMVRFHMPRFF